MRHNLGLNIRSVCENKLCHGCGVCAGLCPSNAVELRETNEGLYKPRIDEDKCTNCGLCYKICSGWGVNFEELNRKTFNKIPQDPFLGNYLGTYVGQACDVNIHTQGTSGGITTALLLYALKEHIINGALVTVMEKLRPRVVLARTPEEIIAAAKSKYCPVPLGIGLKEILKNKGKYALVGLPCHIQSLRKAEMVNPILISKFAFRLGIFCGHGVTHKGTEFLLTRIHVNPNEVLRITYRTRGWPGGLEVELRNGEKKFMTHGKYWAAFFGRFFFTPYRCTLCSDHLAELADISLGDAWLAEFREEKTGKSVILVRSTIGHEILKGAQQKKWVDLQEINPAKVIESQWDGIFFKKKNLRARFALLKFFGGKTPTYKTKLMAPNIWDKVAAFVPYINMWISKQPFLRFFLRFVPHKIMVLYGVCFQKILNRTYPKKSTILGGKNILIIGSFSPNIGDLSIVASMISALKSSLSNVRLTVLASQPNITRRYIAPDVEVFNWPTFRSGCVRANIGNLILLVRNTIWFLLCRIGINLDFLLERRSRNSLKAYTQADLVLGCGGGYLSDLHGSAFLGHIYDIYFALLLKKPFMLYGLSIGPFRNRFYRFIAKSVFNKLNIITLREERSFGFVKEMNVSQPFVEVTADAALQLPSIEKTEAKKILIEEGIRDVSRPLVTITLKPWIFTDSCEPEKKKKEYALLIPRFIDGIVEHTSGNVLIIPMDLDKNAKLEKMLIPSVLEDVKCKDSVFVLKGNYTPKEVKSIIGLGQVHIATRMHSSIFAACENVPIISIAYEPKMFSFMEMLKQGQYVVDIENMSLQEMMVKFNKLWKSREESQRIMAPIIESLKKRSLHNTQLVMSLFKNEASGKQN